ncbi:MAG: PIG-L family deacetylase, partial [Candidatus Bathyarchaeia archaeon]
MNKKVLIFAPHPDDETFGCGGTIAKRVSEGYEVFIIVMTDGRYAYLKLLGVESDPTPEELRETR